MKSLIVALMLAVSGVAAADQIDLYPTGGFGALHQYHNVDTSLCSNTPDWPTAPCDPAYQVSLYLPNGTTNLTGMELLFGNDQLGAWFGPYAGSGQVSVLQYCVWNGNVFDGSGKPVCDYTGQTLQLRIDETSRLVKGGGSGRGGGASHRLWTLLDGTIVY
jgi:hypothetical protein